MCEKGHEFEQIVKDRQRKGQLFFQRRRDVSDDAFGFHHERVRVCDAAKPPLQGALQL